MREGLVDGFVEDGIVARAGGFRVSALVAAAAVLLLGAGEAFAGAQPDVGADTIGCFDQVLGGSPGAVWYLSDTTDPGSVNFTQWTEFGSRLADTFPSPGRAGGGNATGLGVATIAGATASWTFAADPTSSAATDYAELPIELSIIQVSSPVPLAGNWAGPGNPGVGLYYPDTGHFVIDTNPGNPTAIEPFLFGPLRSVTGGNVFPVVGDFNGDGNDSVGVYDDANGIFYLLKQLPINGTDELAPLETSLDNLIAFYFGDPATDMIRLRRIPGMLQYVVEV